jgi:hypothetical protein
MMAKSHDIVPGYLEFASDIGKEFIWVGVLWSVSGTPCLTLSLAPSKVGLGRDLPPTADINAVLPTTGDLEPAA